MHHLYCAWSQAWSQLLFTTTIIKTGGKLKRVIEKPEKGKRNLKRVKTKLEKGKVKTQPKRAQKRWFLTQTIIKHNGLELKRREGQTKEKRKRRKREWGSSKHQMKSSVTMSTLLLLCLVSYYCCFVVVCLLWGGGEGHLVCPKGAESIWVLHSLR